MSYYSEHLSADRLRQCYELAPPRVRQYLEAEIQHVLSRIRPDDAVLELGCGYGRVLARLAPHARRVVGIDSSPASLALGRALLRDRPNCELLEMDAGDLAFSDGSFDVVVCIQNGISAFKVEPGRLLREALRVTRAGGTVLLSSYAARFWPHRLEWFQLQAAHGLVGEIDSIATRDGVIVCKDGFRATTFSADDFQALATAVGVACRVEEVDESSVFCEINK
jgi:2-polyprenyl-6-hydroxyphenyl methylase/3-demethylubiquinone-9 3-methyltransferase